MGVLGLTRWANENERLVSSELTLPVPAGSGSALENGEAVQLSPEGDWLVIDAWAWIHYVWHSMNTNVYQGGSFLHFRVVLNSWVTSLRAAGFHLVVVFDGPRLHQKLGTLLARTQNYVRLNAKLMRAGMNLRTDHEFEHARMLPRGLTEYVYSVLDACEVECVMGAEEVDSAIAQLAEERAGYVLSRDSDFLVLCGNTPRCKGYIPLGSIEFIAMETEPPVEAPAEDDNGFSTVSTRKRGKKSAQQAKLAHLPHVMQTPVLPANASTLRETAVRFRCFSSYKCAELLKIPMSLLPVFAALVGTESRTSEQMELFNQVFHGVSNRMGTIATLLAEQYAAAKEGAAPPPAGGKDKELSEDAEPAEDVAEGNTEANTETKNGEEEDGEEDLLDIADPVVSLLARAFDRIVEFGHKRRGAPLPVSWAQRTSIVRAMHEAAQSYMPAQVSEAMERFMALTELPALKVYQDAYWARHFDQALVSALLERIYIARVYLEEPDEPASQRVIVRPMRSLVWSVLFSVWFTAHPEELEKQIEELLAQMEIAAQEAREREEQQAAEEAKQRENEGDEGEDEGEDEDNKEEAAEEPAEPEPEPEQGPEPITTIAEYTRTEYSLRKDDVPALPVPVVLEGLGRFQPLPPSLAALVDAFAATPEGEKPAPVLVPDLPEATRLDIWRVAHHSVLPELEKLPADVRAFAAALRYTIVMNHERLGTMRTKHNWAPAEIEAAVYTACVTRRVSCEASPVEMQEIVNAYPRGSPANRSITLATTLGFVLQMSVLLTQTLVLTEQVPNARTMWEPPIFHARLSALLDPNGPRPMSESWAKFEDPELFDTLLAVVLQGLESRIGRIRSAATTKKGTGATRQRRHLGLLEETML